MELSLKTKEDYFAELTINIGNAKIIEDLAKYTTKKGWGVDESLIENLITIANDLSKFNNVSDVEFAKKILQSSLNNSDRDEILEWLLENKTK
ncbi:MAG: hypothetical protein PHF86_00940 [Candidatus Nanoarchaeia archaeon]|nr:hypothetical protein [Candidatus Nanoarchaeia archaeon]